MELNNNIINIQGILVNSVKYTGDFTKINYAGGNEEKINYITTELTKYLNSKDYLKDSTCNEKSTQELNEIVLFLGLNTTFKKQLTFEENSHLMNIIPQLSKCLFANICFELGLFQQYGYVLESFPLESSQELLDEMKECLKKAKLKDYLNVSFVLLKSVANKLGGIEFSNKIEDVLEDIVLVANIILQNLTGLFTHQAKNMKTTEIYQHIGFTLLNLLDLLLYIDKEATALKKFLEHVFHTTCSVFKNVTVDIFCEWAEVPYKDQPLQLIIAGTAYLVIEKYRKNKLASELINLLSSIARKPKTLAELIQEADVPTIIKKVNEKCDNQKYWFTALLNTPVFHDPKIVECLAKWWKLCDESDVDRLLSLPLPKGHQERQLIVKCASNLSVENLKLILSKYFHRQKFVWQEDIKDQLIIVFNKIHLNLTQEELKNILLLVLQKAELFFHTFFTYAFNTNSKVYDEIFHLTEDIAKIDSIGLESLMQVFEENTPNNQNEAQYIKFFETLLSCQYYSWDFIVSNILLRLIEKYKTDNSLQEFSCCLQILKHFSYLSCELSRELELYENMLLYASENRCKSFLEFNSVKEEITKCCVDYMLLKVEHKRLYVVQEGICITGENLDKTWSNYYKNLYNSEKINFIDCILPEFNLVNYKEGKGDENFIKLLKVLPCCITTEWNILLNEIEDRCGYSVTLNALTDILILLCDMTEQHLKSQPEDVTLTLSLKFCLQNFGKFLILDSKSKEEKLLVITNTCRLLKHIPTALKATEGLSLVNKLPEEELRSLAQDKNFIARIVLINDKQVCKALAQRILGNT